MEKLVYTIELTKKIVSFLEIKIFGAFIYTLYTFFFDALHTEGLIALFVLIVVDFILGIVASYKAGMPIESGKALRTALKTVIYFTLVSMSFLTETAGMQFLPIDETVIAFLALTEFISILENTSNLGYGIPKKLLNKLKEIKKGDY